MPVVVSNDVGTTLLGPWAWLFPLALAMVGILLGGLIAARLSNWVDRFIVRVQEMSSHDLAIGGLGAIPGSLVVIAMMIPVSSIISNMNLIGGTYFLLFYIVAVLVGGWGGFETFLAVKGEITGLFGTRVVETLDPTDEDRMKGGKLLDTNVIIDGRVADVSRAGFLQGCVYIPGFVLDELQYIADSADPLKRARGRRGLDILNAMRKEAKILARDLDHLIPNSAPVDQKLVALAKRLGADIVTNDYNLNKVAELQGVTVLNINQLANALKPVVMAGEEMTVSIIKEGKEINQGIGYLDDGTMIVVENARRLLGETLDVVVTSVLQTVAGKMIFAAPKSEHEQEEELLGRNIRSYSSGGPRRKTRP